MGLICLACAALHNACLLTCVNCCTAELSLLPVSAPGLNLSYQTLVESELPIMVTNGHIQDSAADLCMLESCHMTSTSACCKSKKQYRY